MEKDLVSIIIVNWNGKKWLKDCFDSLYKQTYGNFEIILVDNGSTDDSVQFVRQHYPQVFLVENGKNSGFGTGNNLGVRHSRGEFIFFLNNDTRSPEHMLEMLVAYIKNSGLNIISPRILNMEGKDPLEGNYLQIDIVGSPGQGKRPFYVEGCSLMVRREDFDKLGGFDEKIFMYTEDIDFCWRAHIYGLAIGICDEAKIIHYGGGSTVDTQAKANKKHLTTALRRFWVEAYTMRNLIKNYQLYNIVWTLPLFVMQNIAESLLYILTAKWNMVATIWKTFWWNLVNLPDTLHFRRKVQSKRVVPDREIKRLQFFGFYKFKVFQAIGVPQFK